MKGSYQAFTAAVLIALSGAALAQSSSASVAPRSDSRPPGATAKPSAADRSFDLRLASIDTSEKAFDELDQDHDGRISPLEAANKPKVAAAFTLADTNRDGYLSKAEFQALSVARPSADIKVLSADDQRVARNDDHASYPTGDRASYPSGDRASYPSGDHASYPSGDRASYPSGDRASYPSGDQRATRPTDPPPAAPVTPRARSYPPR
ncbi:MAG TPA: EF-hand domain-containing protein [Steroidobacteraceae bacterium]